MKTVLQKLFSASAWAASPGGFFVLALTGLIAAAPGTLRAETARYMRFTAVETQKDNSTSNPAVGTQGEQGVAFYEFRAQKAGVDIAPNGMSIVDASTGEGGLSGSNLLDDVYNSSNGTKYWSKASGMTFTLDMGVETAVDGYSFRTADAAYRNPIAWNVELSNDKTNWVRVDQRNLRTKAKAVALGTNAECAYTFNYPAVSVPADAVRYVRFTFNKKQTDGVALSKCDIRLNGTSVIPEHTQVTSSAYPNIARPSELLENDSGWAQAKWWSSVATPTFTYDFGQEVAFDSYTLKMADVNYRNPIAWTADVSADSVTWRTVDTQDYGDAAGAQTLGTNATGEHVYSVELVSAKPQPTPTGRSVNFVLGACGSLGADLSGTTRYGIAPYQVAGSGWNNLNTTTPAANNSIMLSDVKDAQGFTVDGATFAINDHGQIISVTSSTAATVSDTVTSPDYCLLPSSGGKMAVAKSNNSADDSFVFSGVPYKKFAVVLYLGRGSYTAGKDGHDPIIVKQTQHYNYSDSGQAKTYSTKYTYVDGQLTIVDGEKIADGNNKVGLWGDPDINYTNTVGESIMVLPNQEADKDGQYTFQMSWPNNGSATARTSFRSTFRAVSFVELADDWHEPLKAGRGSIGFVLGKCDGKGEDLSTSGYYGLNGYALRGSDWNLINHAFGNSANTDYTAASVKDRDGSTVEGMGFTLHQGTKSEAFWAVHNARVLHPFALKTPYVQNNGDLTITLTGVPYKRYKALLYLGKDIGYHTDRSIQKVTVTIDGASKDYTYVNGVLTEGASNWGAYTQAGIVGLEGVGVMVLPGLTAADITFKTNGGSYNSQFQGVQIVEETDTDVALANEVRMLHRFDFEDTMSGGTKLAVVDKGSSGRAFPVVTDEGSRDLIIGDGKFGRGMKSCKPISSSKTANSDGFKLRNVDGLGCGFDTGFTVSLFAKVETDDQWKNPFSFTLDNSLNIRLEQSVIGSNGNGAFTWFAQKANSSDGTTFAWSGSSTASYTARGWVHVALVGRSVAEGGPALDLYANGVYCGTATTAEFSGTQKLTEFLVGRARRYASASQTGQSNDSNNSNYRDPNPTAVHLDEVALFDRALSADDVAWLSTHEAAVPPANANGMRTWAAIPTACESISVGSWNWFAFKLSAPGLRHVGGEIPVVLPNAVELRSVSVRWNIGNDTNVRIRRLILVDPDGVVAAVSELSQARPGNYYMSTAFGFPEGTSLDPSTLYKGYFTGDYSPAIGDTYQSAWGLSARFGVFDDASATANGFYVNTGTAVPMMRFALHVPSPDTVTVNGNAINVNFQKGSTNRLTDTEVYGLVPFLGSQWNWPYTTTGNEINWTDISLVDSTGGVTNIQLAATGRSINTFANQTVSPLLTDGLLDDGSNLDRVTVTVSGIPYTTYDAYVYMATDQWTKNGSVTVNDNTAQYWHMPEGAEVAVPAAASTGWGDTLATVPTLGKNVMRIAGLSGASLKLTAHRIAGTTRGVINAVQIVERKEMPVMTWTGTVRGNVSADALTVTASDGTTANLAALSAADTVILTAEGTPTLTLAKPLALASLVVKGGGTLTLAGHALTAPSANVQAGGLVSADGALAVDAVRADAGAFVGFSGTADFAGKLSGAGSVRILEGASVSLTAANDYTGGTEALGTLRWGGEGTLGTGTVTMPAGGIFDLNGLFCAQAITLDGGTLTNTTGTPLVASVNFNSNDTRRVADNATGGLLPMLGTYWTNLTAASGTNALTVYPETAITGAGATGMTLADALTWSATHWSNDGNSTSYLKGYLDDANSGDFTKYVTLSLPETLAARGYDVYYYHSTDSALAFAAHAVSANGDATVYYTYSGGVLATTTTPANAPWGSAGDGRGTVAEGVNVMVLRNRTETSLKLGLLNRGGNRGSIAALQVRVHAPAYAGALTVRSDSFVESGANPLLLRGVTVSGSGNLTKRGAGEVTLAEVTMGVRKLSVATGALTLGAGNDLSSTQVEVAAGATATAPAGQSTLTLSGVSGAGTLALGDVTDVTLTGGYGATAAFTGTLNRTVTSALTLTKQGTSRQTFTAMSAQTTLRVSAGTLGIVASTAQRAENLYLDGGAFTADGVGVFSAGFAQMASGNVTLSATGTAAMARPVAATASAATVAKFTLAQNGTIRYIEKADFSKYFPKGFVPQGSYKIVLGSDLADELMFPYTFTVLGADPAARFTLYTSDGTTLSPVGSYTASGSTITLKDSSAVIGAEAPLAAPTFHYDFNNDNLNAAADATNNTGLTGEGTAVVYADSENGRSFAGGTPFGALAFGSGDWTMAAYVNTSGMSAGQLFFGMGASGSNGALLVTRGAGDTLNVWYRAAGAYSNLLSAALEGGDACWHFVLLTHSRKYLRLYVDGVLAATAEGTFDIGITGLQIGKGYTGSGYPGGVSDWTGGAIDDWAFYPSVLRETNQRQAMAALTGRWRWHAADTADALFNPALTDWTDTLGASGAYPGTGIAAEMTVRATLQEPAALGDLFNAMTTHGFAAKTVLLSGEALTCMPLPGVVTQPPAEVSTFFVSNDLTVDLSAIAAELVADALGPNKGVEVVRLNGLSGAVTLKNVPAGFDASFVVTAGVLRVWLASQTFDRFGFGVNFYGTGGFTSGVSGDTLFGMAPDRVAGKNWNNRQHTSGDLNTRVNYTLDYPKTLLGTTGSGVTISGITGSGWGGGDRGYDNLTKGIAEGPQQHTIANLPAGNYRLVLYMDGAGASANHSPFKINDTFYFYVGDVLTTSTETPTVTWGVANTTASVEGQNVMTVPVTVTDSGAFANRIYFEACQSNKTEDWKPDWMVDNSNSNLCAFQVVAMPEVYTRTVSGDANWSATDAWTLASDPAVMVAEPPAGAAALVTLNGNATLKMTAPDVSLARLMTFGEGTLTLRYDGSWLTDNDYRAIPVTGTTLNLLSVSSGYDIDAVRVWMDELNYGATATVTQTADGATAKITLPVALYPADTGLISVNFWDRDNHNNNGGGALNLSGNGTSGYTGYNANVGYWSQTDGSKAGTLSVKSVPYAQRTTTGATVTEYTNALTYAAYATWSFNSAKGLLSGFLNDRPLGSTSGDNSNLTLTIPADWSSYTALIYGVVNTGTNKFTPRRVNEAWYTYQDGALTKMSGVTGQTPGTDGLWGDNGVNNDFVEGTNLMIVPGLTGDFKLEWYVTFNGSSLENRGPVAAIQLMQEATPDLAKAKVFRAEVSGTVDWANLQWKNASGTLTSAPGVTDTVELVLTGDATVTCGTPAEVAALRVSGNGHAVAFPDRAALTVDAWAFLNDTTLALTSAAETLPETSSLPRRVRYDYDYTGNVTTTTAYETEFAAGFAGAFTPAGGLVEFSGGKVAFSEMNVSATRTKVVFSGDAQVTTAERFSLQHADVTLRDRASVVTERVLLTNGSSTPRTTSLTLEDASSLTVTGSNNENTNQASFLMSHWSGNATVTLRDDASIVSEQAELVLCHGDDPGQTERLILEDNATVRVAGVSVHSSNNATDNAVILNGGRLLIGSRGLRNYGLARTFTMAFNGGSIGAWQDIALGSDAAAAVPSVTGTPRFVCEGDATLTLTQPAPFASDPTGRMVFAGGNVRVTGSTFSALPQLELRGGTLRLTCLATTPRLTLRGGTLSLEGGFLTMDAFNADADTLVRVPLVERLSEGGYLSMAGGKALPDFGHVVFDLVLDPDRAETSRVLPMVPLCLGSYVQGTDPAVKGFGVSNNTNGAITDYEAVFASGNAGAGLYAALTGAEVLKQHTVTLNQAVAPGGYPLIQSTVDAYPYHVFSGAVDGARLLIPDGGIALPHAAFVGQSIRVVAGGSSPHTLLRGIGCTFSTDVTFDLSAWAAAMPAFVRGAVKDVPASLCLISGGVVKAPPSVALTVDLGTYTLPDGFIGTVETTAAGVYYVVCADRRARTVSVNFTDAAVPLSAPPSAIGAYALPVAAWNDLAGVFSSSALRMSDFGGVSAVPAVGVDGAPTQLLAYTSLTNRDDGASASLLKVWLDDSAAQTVRLAHVPFAAYRLAFIFSNDLEGAAYAPVTVDGVPYSMDAEGYVRRDIRGYVAKDTQGLTTIDIPADTAWGSTDRTEAAAPVLPGRNALVTDVFTSPGVAVSLPAFVYGRRYAGLAALQVLEAPEPPATGTDGKDYAYAFMPADDGNTLDLTDLDLTVEGMSLTETWVNDPGNTLTLTCDYDVTLVLPENFEADRIVCKGDGTLTLKVANGGGAALNALNAALMANVTVGFPCLGVTFAPATGVSRFESLFDNAGANYVIARGATLSLSADSGIVTNFDSGAATLTVDNASLGTFRRDYPVTFTVDFGNLAQATLAGRNLLMNNPTTAHVVMASDLLIEDGDTLNCADEGLWFGVSKNTKTYRVTQTGGSVDICTNSGDRGIIVGVNNSVPVAWDARISGGRFAASQIHAWIDGSVVDVDVSGTGTLALANGAGSNAYAFNSSGANSSLAARFSGDGTFEALTSQVTKSTGAGAFSMTFNGGRLTTSQAEATFAVPMVFAGAATSPTEIAPDPLSVLTLSAANSGTGALVVTQGTLAVSHAQALGNASVTVASGAVFEARGFTEGAALSGSVTFAAGSICSATADTPTLPYTAAIASAIAFPAGTDQVTFRLNGEAYTPSGVTVNEAKGTVTFNDGGKAPITAVTWKKDAVSGDWQNGVGGVDGPWVGDAIYRDGAAVTFDVADGAASDADGAIVGRADVFVKGRVRPGALNFTPASEGHHRFFQGSEGAYAVVSGSAVSLGAEQMVDVPIATAVDTGIAATNLTMRLFGLRSNASAYTLVGSGNVGGGTQGSHGIWHADGAGDMTIAPHADETQTLSPFGTHLQGAGVITVSGQTAADGSVSGGTVQLAGHTAGTNWNASFIGNFMVRDGGTLDLTMTRERANGDQYKDEHIYFREIPVGSIPFTLRNGATLRFSGCRGVLGGYAQSPGGVVSAPDRIHAQLIVVGRNSRVAYAYPANHADGVQYNPYGFRLNGDGATVLMADGAATGKNVAYRGLLMARGASFVVAGVGDEGDPSDPKTDMTVDSGTYGKLTEGIETFIDATEGTGLARWNRGIAEDAGVFLNVGTGSTLRVRADLVMPNGSTTETPFVKTGAGRVTFEYPSIAVKTLLLVNEGVLGGSSDFTNGATEATVATGAVIEAGLRIPLLTLSPGATLRLDPSGRKQLRADRVLFTAGGAYTVDSLLAEADIPSAVGLEPIKVMGWSGVQGAGSSTFTLSSALEDKGYGLEVRDDGLYLMSRVVYVRELNFTVDTANPLATYLDAWYAEGGWYRQDTPDTKRNYDPAENEAVTALFLLPEAYADETLVPPSVTLVLSKPVTFASVRFAVKQGDDSLKTLTVPVTYHYNLTTETMPGKDEALSFTWVPTLSLVSPTATAGLAKVTAAVPEGYEYALRDATVVIYSAASAPAINVNFTGKTSGDPSWIDASSSPCGVVPFAGVYWNNASVVSGDYIGTSGGFTLYNLHATVAGVEPDAATGEAVTTEVTFGSVGATSVASRRGTGNAGLAAGFLKGSSTTTPDTALLTQAGMAAANTKSGWQVRVASVPFEAYDLYLLFAGAADGTVSYPAVRVKLGDADWRTFTWTGDWAAPASTGDEWSGTGGLVDGGFADGGNLLHLRLSAPSGSALQIAPCDGGQPSEAAASAAGLAALQIVRCDDGAAYERLGSGKWSDPSGWRLTLPNGADTGAWKDSTLSVPRPARIPATSLLTADMPASLPYLRLTGGATMRLPGTAGVLSAAALDLGSADAGSTFHFENDVFARPPNVVLAPDITFTLPEGSGTVTNRWRWVYDDATRTGSSTSATLQKTGSGDLVITEPMQNRLQIDDGTLWLGGDASYSSGAAISGNGTFGKTGTGTLTLTAAPTVQGLTPIRVSQGTLTLNANLTGIGASRTVLVDGGTMELTSGKTYAADTTISAKNGGRFIVNGSHGAATVPVISLEGNGHLSQRTGSDSNGYLLDRIRVSGKGNTITPGPNNYGGMSLGVENGLVVEAGAELTLSGGDTNLRVVNGIVEVQEDAQFISKRPVGRGSRTYYGSPSDLLRKTGAGLWRIEKTLSNKGDAANGQKFDIDGGEACFAFGGNAYGASNSTPITVNAGGTLSGNVNFSSNANSPVTVEMGGTVRSGVTGVANSKVTFKQATFKDGSILACDLSNANPLTVATTATLPSGTITVKLLNLGSMPTAAAGRQLMAWPAGTTTGSTEFSSAEAVALDAKFDKRSNGLWIIPSNAAYLWKDMSNVWSSAHWSTNTVTDLSFPASGTVPSARVQSATADFTLTVDKGTAGADGKVWASEALVFSAASGRVFTLAQGAVADGTGALSGLNGVSVASSLWKLDAGRAASSVPLVFANTGAGTTLNVAGGTLALAHPLTVGIPATGSGSMKTTVPAAVEIGSGATLAYALAPTQAEKNYLATAYSNGLYDPLTQTLTGAVTGDGTLSVDGADTTVELKGTADSNVGYAVGQGTLKLSGEIASSARTARRTVTVGAQGRLELNAAAALGWTTNWVWRLEAAAPPSGGAMVATASNARVRGALEVTGSGAAQLGLTSGVIDGGLSFAVPAGATLNLAGNWQTPEDTTSGALLKTGAGTLDIQGIFSSNLPMTVREGTVTLSGSLSVDDLNNGATKADWSIEKGSRLVIRTTDRNDLGDGSLSVHSGATLSVAATASTLYGKVAFADGSVMVFGENNTPGRIVFNSATTVAGTVTVDLDALDPDALSSGTAASYQLIEFAEGARQGSGTFQLGGRKLVQWAEKGWALLDRGNEVRLEAFGGTDGTYIWNGDVTATGAGNWAKPFWVAPNATEVGPWPTTGTPYVSLQDRNPLNVDVEIPAEARTLDWTLPAQSLAAFRCSNTQPGAGEPSHDYVLTASGGASNTLTIDGDFIKTGTAKLTVRRPVTFGRDGALKLLGGETAFFGAVTASSGTFNKPVTLAGDATLRFSDISSKRLLGLLEGDGTGTIVNDGVGTLTLGSDLGNLKALTVNNGSVSLSAPEQYAVAPAVTLAGGASLGYAGTLSSGGDVTLRVNAGQPAQGTLLWAALASAETARAPRLAAPEGLTGPAVNVSTFRFRPGSGHLILDPGTAVLPSTATLDLPLAAAESTALWLGARTGAGTSFALSGLTGSGLVGVEPETDLFSDAAWSTNRVLTLSLNAASAETARTFNGVFMGALTSGGTPIRAGLSVRNAGAEALRFVYAGKSTDAYLGALTVADNTRVEVTGVWGGSAAVRIDGTLAGNGTVGAAGRTVTVPAGATISGSVYGKRPLTGGTFREETIPSTLTVKGTLSLVPHSKLNVLIRKDRNEAPWVSCVQAETLSLPLIVEGSGNEVMLDIHLDIEEGAYASDRKILGWNTISGAGKINGTITVNGGPNTGYILRQKADGLYLRKSNARFWMILR